MLDVLQQYGVLASFLAALVSLAGAACVWAAREKVVAWSGLLSAFAAGMLLTTVLTHLFPEAFHATPHAPLYALGGYGALLLVSGITGALMPHASGQAALQFGAALTAWLGIAFHSLVDGGVYAITYASGLETGLLTMGGLTVHKFIDAVILFALMSLYLAPRRALLYTVLGAALTTPLGAIFATLWLDTHQHAAAAGFSGFAAAASHNHVSSLGPLLAAAGGTLLYVSASHLVPHMLENRNRLVLPLFALGCAFSLGLAALLH